MFDEPQDFETQIRNLIAEAFTTGNQTKLIQAEKDFGRVNVYKIKRDSIDQPKMFKWISTHVRAWKHLATKDQMDYLLRCENQLVALDEFQLQHNETWTMRTETLGYLDVMK